MIAETDPEDQKTRRQDELRRLMMPGRINVNVMTKVDCTIDRVDNRMLDPDKTDASERFEGIRRK